MLVNPTITSANPAADLYAQVATALTAEGFTLVDTVVISTRTHKVWKSAAADNIAGVDWYLDVAYTTAGAGSIWFFPFEDYNPVTHIAFRGAIASGSAVIDAATSSFHGSTGAALESATSGLHAGTPTVMRLTCPTTSFGAWIDVTIDRVIGNMSGDATKLLYCGLFEPFSHYATKAGAALYPLIVTQLWSSTSSPASSSASSSSSAASATATASLTRLAPATSITGWSNHVHVRQSIVPVTDLVQVPGGNQQLNDRAGSRITLLSGETPSGLLGWLYDVVTFLAAGSVVRGDTITAVGDATQWRCTSADGNSVALAFRAA